MIQYATSHTELWRELFDYWKSKQHADGRPPSRRDLDPIVDIPHLAGNLILFDVRPDGYRYRLIGSANTIRWGEDLTGKMLGSGLRPPRVVPGWRAVYDMVSQDRKPRIVISRMKAGDQTKHILVVMPLSDDAGAIDCLLVGVFYEGDFRRGEQIEGLLTQEIEL
jgi:hypothetical protein